MRRPHIINNKPLIKKLKLYCGDIYTYAFVSLLVDKGVPEDTSKVFTPFKIGYKQYGPYAHFGY